ncbi:MAG: S49 family peptidase, partial [Candidatus Binataceae bacterium]
MNLARIRDLLMTRQGRLGVVVAILALLGAIALGRGARATGVAMFVLAIAMVAAFVMLVVRPARIPRDATLQIRLAGRIREYAPRSILDQVIGRGFPTLFHLRQALEAAAGDDKIRAVIVEIAGFEPGLATASELHDLIKAVRDSGKRVVALLAGDTTRVREYLVACGATEVVANPDTMVAMLGVAAGGLFLKGAMRKAGVDAQTLQWKEYKGAAEMFSREEMSAPLRESLAALVGDWRSAIADKVGRTRKLDRDRARNLLGAGFLSASAAREAGLFDRVGYIEDIRAELDPGGKERKFVGLARYMRHIAYAAGHGARPR